MGKWQSRKPHGLAHNSPETGMGMDRDRLAFRDDEMLLAGAGFDQDKVSRRQASRHRNEAGFVCRGKPLGRIGIAQAIACGRHRFAVNRSEAGIDQSDAIEPAHRVAAMQAKRGANKLCGSTHQPVARRCWRVHSADWP